jgi:PAS domain S-box-containing protein
MNPLLHQKAIEASITPIAMADLEGRWTYVNPAFIQLWGYKTANEVMQKPLTAFWDPKHSIPDILKIVSDKEKWAGELTAKRSDGTSFTVQASLSLVKDEKNKPSQIMASFTDLTEQKRAEAALRNAQKLESLGVLAGGIAHDFNNLLVGVLGNATLALKKLPENNEARKFLDDIIMSAQTASKLTSQLLAYSGKGRFIVQPINVSQQILKIERLLQLSISKNTELIFELEEELPLINGDTTQIHQVVINLVTNASEALEGKQGVVTVCTGTRMLSHHQAGSPVTQYQIESGRYVFIKVTDNGCGMSTKTVEKIFDPFFTTKFAGRGLGLSAVQGIVIAHCGTLHVESRQAKGTCIEVCFPVADEAEEKAPVERPKTKIYYVNKPPTAELKHITGTVLIVDDENVVRTVASHILDEIGMKILSAENGKKAIDIYKKDPARVDVILLDMTMPVMNGVETFKELKKINPNVKVILTSGYSADEVKLNFDDSNDLAGFLEKPFTAQALSEKIRAVIMGKVPA